MMRGNSREYRRQLLKEVQKEKDVEVMVNQEMASTTANMMRLAFISRLLLIAVQYGSHMLLPKYKPDVFRSPIDDSVQPALLDSIVENSLGGLRNWDGEYFLHIAEYGYTYENTLAFYPLYPVLVGIIARFIFVLKLLSLRNCCLLAGVTFNLCLFCIAVKVLYKLSLRITNNPVKSRYSILLFCINPASIFFLATYSECLYLTLTLCLIFECVTKMRLTRLTVFLSLSILTRSNGILNIGFIVYYLGKRIIFDSRERAKYISKLILVPLMSLIPLALFNIFVYEMYCIKRYAPLNKHSSIVEEYANQRNYILSGLRVNDNSPWCDFSIPHPYSYIQSHYWNVGFLKYYHWKQIPNFILAAPILYFVISESLQYMQSFIDYFLRSCLQFTLRRYNLFPFTIHSLVLATIGLFFVHVQISTRLICSATPLIYWYAAEYMRKDSGKMENYILIWFVWYCLIGTICFSVNLPWT